MQYISGWQALNIPNEKGLVADWHPLLHLNEPLKFYEPNSLLGDKGITKRYVADKEYFVASFARAIADLVYEEDTAELKGCVNDFLDEDDEKELFEYLKIINTKKNIENFIKFELTKLYFKEKTNA